jgi:hypothetical protein
MAVLKDKKKDFGSAELKVQLKDAWLDILLVALTEMSKENSLVLRKEKIKVARTELI